MRIVLLVTSPRLPAGLLTAAAWDLVRAHPVFAGAESEQIEALRIAGVAVSVVDPDPEVLIQALATDGTVVWLAGPAGDEDLARRPRAAAGPRTGPGRDGADVRLLGPARVPGCSTRSR